ncbi:hypothetical protein [Micrococcoides hystricis]|uniref:Uncharacterized protein n=1 Tax=Micrococcoides hystricis TaxID=1572761 RepID=A0ABV6PCU6_9MICC
MGGTVDGRALPEEGFDAKPSQVQGQPEGQGHVDQNGFDERGAQGGISTDNSGPDKLCSIGFFFGPGVAHHNVGAHQAHDHAMKPTISCASIEP